jgi:hypothetical protein
MRAGETMNAIPGSRAGPARPACFLGLLAVLCTASAATADPPSEAAVKAAFVYNFAKFVEWPAHSSAQNAMTLCVAGTRPELAASLAELAGKTVQGHPLAVKSNVGAADLDACHVLFLGNDARPLAGQARGRAGLLTVSDVPGFAQSGGMIGLFNEGDRIRFEINPRSAEAAGLKVSSQLMKLAKVVEP